MLLGRPENTRYHSDQEGQRWLCGFLRKGLSQGVAEAFRAFVLNEF